eukprot:816216-Prymnesium_polylepis.1
MGGACDGGRSMAARDHARDGGVHVTTRDGGVHRRRQRGGARDRTRAMRCGLQQRERDSNRRTAEVEPRASSALHARAAHRAPSAESSPRTP